MQQRKKNQTHVTRKAKIIIPVAVVVGLAALIIGGFGVGAKLEENNNFCGSCHTQPETTFLEQSQVTPPINLASFHIQQEDVRCVDCHSAPGTIGRVEALLNGLSNGIKLWTGNAAQPGKYAGAFPSANCLKCHTEFSVSVSPETAQSSGHWHYYLSEWAVADPNAATCATCHQAHKTGGDAGSAFVILDNARPVCSACHASLGGD